MTYDDFRVITISQVLFKTFEHCLMNGFQTFFTSGVVGAHTDFYSLQQPLDDNNSSSSNEDEDSSDFRGVGIGNGSSCIINLWRLPLSVPRGATCWLRTGTLRTCALLWILCYARVIYECGMPCLSCGYMVNGLLSIHNTWSIAYIVIPALFNYPYTLHVSHNYTLDGFYSWAMSPWCHGLEFISWVTLFHQKTWNT